MTDINTQDWENHTYEIDGWFHMSVGNHLIGRVVGVKAWKDREDDSTRLAFLVRNAHDVLVVNDDCEENSEGNKIPITLEKNSIIAITERAALRAMRECVPHRCMVSVKVLGKKKLDKKRTMWQLDFKSKGPKGRFIMPSMGDTSPALDEGPPREERPTDSAVSSSWDDADDFF